MNASTAPASAATATPPGSRAAIQVHSALNELAETHPEWFARFEDTDSDRCTHDELIELLDTAPSAVAIGFLYGKLSLRETIAQFTGRPLPRSIAMEAAPTAGSQTVAKAHRALSALNESHPEWYATFEDADPDVCTQQQLMELLETAPTSLARGFLMGKLTLRQTYAALTGRPML